MFTQSRRRTSGESPPLRSSPTARHRLLRLARHHLRSSLSPLSSAISSSCSSSLMACANLVKLNSSSSLWIGQQSFSQRRRSSARRVAASPIRAGAYTDELVKTAVSS
ncbi:hypothetical protein L484_019829 [Morus notabilis]|uniref:Uncharacterized protein n=1 Tax=Morus notabilis TaxID=981085 RepID=W9S1U5_9ROSA|nr:hypothetical protein L484_019829 [Morus notabilis]